MGQLQFTITVFLQHDFGAAGLKLARSFDLFSLFHILSRGGTKQKMTWSQRKQTYNVSGFIHCAGRALRSVYTESL